MHSTTDLQGRCCIRPDIRRFMYGQITIAGFSKRSIKAYCNKFFESSKTRKTMLEQAKKVHIYHLFNIPIIVLMACVIYEEKRSLPQSRTKVFHEVYQLMVSRSMERLPEGERFSKEYQNRLLCQLGQLAMERLMVDYGILVAIDEEYINKLSPDIIKLGILSPSGFYTSTLAGKRCFCFPSRSLAEFSGAQFLYEEVKRTKTLREALDVLCKWFWNADDLLTHGRVIYFLCELLKEAPIQRNYLIGFVWYMLADHNAGHRIPHIDEFFSDSALHTPYGHFYNRDPTPNPICCLSKNYWLRYLWKDVEWNVPENVEVPEGLRECNIRVSEWTLRSNLFKKINQYQQIRYLELHGASYCEDDDWPAEVFNFSPCIQVVIIRGDALPPHVLNHILSVIPQLSNLKTLELSFMPLSISLPATFPPLLEEVCLRKSEFGKEDVPALISVAQNPSLRKLNISRNRLSEEDVDQVIEAAVTHRADQKLELTTDLGMDLEWASEGLDCSRSEREVRNSLWSKRWKKRCEKTQIRICSEMWSCMSGPIFSVNSEDMRKEASLELERIFGGDSGDSTDADDDDDQTIKEIQ